MYRKSYMKKTGKIKLHTMWWWHFVRHGSR